MLLLKILERNILSCLSSLEVASWRNALNPKTVILESIGALKS